MIGHVVSAGIGAALAGRGKPRTRILQRHIYGPRTGQTYLAEELPDSSVLVVHADDGSQVTFIRAQEKGWTHIRALGNQQTVAGICQDLEGK